MTPEELAKPGTEHAHQRAFFCWCNQQQYDSRIRRAFAIPNGGERNVAVAARLKAEGVKPGVPDVFLPIPVFTSNGLWIEFKKPGDDSGKGKGVLSQDQKEWQSYLISQNYSHFVAYTHLQAQQAVLQYLGIRE